MAESTGKGKKSFLIICAVHKKCNGRLESTLSLIGEIVHILTKFWYFCFTILYPSILGDRSNSRLYKSKVMHDLVFKKGR